MEEFIKNRVIIASSIVGLIFLVVAVGSCHDALRQKAGRNKEMAARLDAEEKLSKYIQEKSTIDAQLAKITQELAAEKTAHQSTKSALLQEQLVNKSLKEELEKVIRLKEALEVNLKEALVDSAKLKLKSK